MYNWHTCPNYMIDLLKGIDRRLKIIMWNINQKEYDSPFDNSGNTFKFGNFEIMAYDWNDDHEQEYNFIYRVNKNKANMPDLKIRWYKYLGRITEINQQVDPDVFIGIYDDIIAELNRFAYENLDEEDDVDGEGFKL